jgi:hypothetical protein
MGKAGQALKQVLETYGISQNRLAVTMGTLGDRMFTAGLMRMADPAADAVLEIRDGLEKLNPDAAEEFIRLYLKRATEDD